MAAFHWRLASIVALVAAVLPAQLIAQRDTTRSGALISRRQLDSAAAEAELASRKGSSEDRERFARVAASIRERLQSGDFEVGDRVVVTIVTDSVRSETIMVRSGRIIDLPSITSVSLEGVLHSELQDVVRASVLKYVKARRVDATPLVRLAVLGDVRNPGFYNLAYDISLADAVMAAGGPTPIADMRRSVIKRGGRDHHAAKETSAALAQGMTLDQFGLQAGDELIIGQQRQGVSSGTMVAWLGGIASVVTMVATLHRR